jgi:hypothetical protein
MQKGHHPQIAKMKYKPIQKNGALKLQAIWTRFNLVMSAAISCATGNLNSVAPGESLMIFR